MRQVMIQIPREEGDKAFRIAEKHGAMNMVRFAGESGKGGVEVLNAHVPNKNIGPLIDELEAVSELHFTILPQGTLPMKPPPSEAPDQVVDPSPLSPIEIILSGLQSIGSWKGFLAYAAAAGIVVWIGLYTNTIYLLIAAMLIAPFAGPAMNAAIGTARGDWMLLRQGIIRYFVSLGTGILMAALLSLILQQKVATATMVDISEISRVAVLLALTAGAAGAAHLVQPARNSLVSGAAVGMLVAASLAPPAGVVGMSIVIGRWSMALGGLFLLLTQLAGINLAGAIVFRLYHVTPKGVRYPRGNSRVATISFAVSALLLAGLLLIQFWEPPTLERSSIAGRADAVIQEAVDLSEIATLVESNARFTRAEVGEQNTLLCIVYAQRAPGVTLSDEQMKKQLAATIRDSINEQDWNLTPMVTVTILAPP